MNATTAAALGSTLRRVLVLLDDDPGCAVRIRLAAHLAATHDCELEGLAPTGLLRLPPGINSAAHAVDAADLARQAALLAAHARLPQFRTLAANAGARTVSDQVIEGDTAPVLLHEAACHDLVVIGQPSPEAIARRTELATVERLLLNNPRPTLLVPSRCTASSVGRNVVVAWDDGPACIRAATDALPLLRHARRVHLCTWHRSHEGAGIAQRLASVSRWFGQHGVEAEPTVGTAGQSLGHALLHGATGLGADLIVMGVYGHSRWIERVAGGVTRTALVHAGVPLLMSH